MVPTLIALDDAHNVSNEVTYTVATAPTNKEENEFLCFILKKKMNYWIPLCALQALLPGVLLFWAVMTVILTAVITTNFDQSSWL